MKWKWKEQNLHLYNTFHLLKISKHFTNTAQQSFHNRWRGSTSGLESGSHSSPESAIQIAQQLLFFWHIKIIWIYPTMGSNSPPGCAGKDSLSSALYFYMRIVFGKEGTSQVYFAHSAVLGRYELILMGKRGLLPPPQLLTDGKGRVQAARGLGVLTAATGQS